MAIPPNSHLKVPARGDLPGIDRANAAALLSRGLTRFFAAHGLVSLPEFTLRSGRRADLCGLKPNAASTHMEERTAELQFIKTNSYARFWLKIKKKLTATIDINNATE